MSGLCITELSVFVAVVTLFFLFVEVSCELSLYGITAGRCVQER
jgi:hypothetical protein